VTRALSVSSHWRTSTYGGRHTQTTSQLLDQGQIVSGGISGIRHGMTSWRQAALELSEHLAKQRMFGLVAGVVLARGACEVTRVVWWHVPVHTALDAGKVKQRGMTHGGSQRPLRGEMAVTFSTSGSHQDSIRIEAEPWLYPYSSPRRVAPTFTAVT